MKQINLFGEEQELPTGRAQVEPGPPVKRLGVFHSLAIETEGDKMTVRDSHDEIIASGTQAVVVNVPADELERSAQSLINRAVETKDVTGTLAFVQSVALQIFGFETITEYIRAKGSYKTLARMAGLSPRLIRWLAKFEGLSLDVLRMVADGRIATGVAHNLATKSEAVQAEALKIAQGRPGKRRALTQADIDSVTRVGYNHTLHGLALAPDIPVMNTQNELEEAHSVLDSAGVARMDDGQPLSLAERIRRIIP
jgi:hypothetical protein